MLHCQEAMELGNYLFEIYLSLNVSVERLRQSPLVCGQVGIIMIFIIIRPWGGCRPVHTGSREAVRNPYLKEN